MYELCMANKLLKEKLKELYYIEYGIAHMGGTGRRGIEYHKSRVLQKNQVNKVLKKLNKKWEYTTLFKKKGDEWDILG